MIFISVLVLTTLITLADLTQAWLYSGSPDHWGISLIQTSRSVLMLGLAGWGAIQAVRSGAVFGMACLYTAIIVIYFVITGGSIDTTVAIGSAAKLMLPILLMAVGYGTLRSPEQLTGYAILLAGLACLSTLFGMWDIRHTEFWTDTLEFGHYLNGVKGIVTGFDGYYVLPFNFFGYESQRRAAGLVAAPLAQGSFVVIGCLLGFAAFHRRSFLIAAAILLLGLIGVWQSGTRGAMLMMAIALPLFLLLTGRDSGLKRNALILLAIAVLSFETLSYIVSYSVNLEDGSSIGHLEAFLSNLADFDQALLLGDGIGAAGSIAADKGLELTGGGEGALFSILFQIGLPGVVLFLGFAGLALKRLSVWAPLTGQNSSLCYAVFCLGIGLIPTLVTSEHILALSGVGVFWIALGGALSQVDGIRKESKA